VARVAIILASILVTIVIGWIMLANADRIFHRIGRMGAYAITRIMALILAAVAIQFIILGVPGVYVEYFRPILFAATETGLAGRAGAGSPVGRGA